MAQKKNAKPAANLKKFYGILGVLALVGVGAIAWIVVRSQTSRAAMEPVAVPGADDPQALVQKAQGMTIGRNDAPAKMLVFSDFQCPYCGTFALQVEPLLVQEFVNTGKLQFVYYDYPLGGTHRFSFLASRAARCAGEQNKFWEYHNALFAKQSEWSFEENAPVGKLLDYGKELGLDRGQFQQCVKSDKYQDVVSANHTLGQRLMVNATPTVFVNGRKIPTNNVLDIKAYRDMINSVSATP